MPVLFAVTLFVSASLLFMVQPMVGRMVLPLLGGSPAAWNTCMVFFQMMLLLGYLYAHKVTTRFGPRQQVFLHAGVLAFAAATLGVAAVLSDRHSPIAVLKSLAPQNTEYPMFGVLALLFVAVGIPFLAVSTSAPLLQRWFAYTGHPASKDPYFLYAASNAGSLISLLGYPLVTEPSLSVLGQAWVWAIGFVVLAGLILLCGSKVSAAVTEVKTDPSDDGPPPSLGRKVRWVALAFVPSSLMLGVTTHMTTDIASVPLLWVGPLALYLLTFIIAFARMPQWFRPVLGNVSPVLTLLLCFIITAEPILGQPLPPFWMLAVHLLVYFFAALMCHTELAFDRPPAAYLTNFFLLMSVGGMLGGVLNALVAPVIFPVPYEYPIAIAIGCMMVPWAAGEGRTFRVLDIAIPVGMGAAVYGLSLLPQSENFGRVCEWIAENMSNAAQFCRVPLVVGTSKIQAMIVYAVPAMACFLFIDRPLRFGLCVAAFLGVSTARQYDTYTLKTDRSFFGVLKVQEYRGERRLVHGTTLHGKQLAEDEAYGRSYNPWFLDVAEGVVGAGAFRAGGGKQDPLTYYHRSGPVGHMVRIMEERDPNGHFAMVGLGSGSVSCYAKKGQSLTFYEIDPAVKHLVAGPDAYFTYVNDAVNRGADVEIVLGDARLKLEEQTDRRYKLLMVDAFSSDSIPVHLLTKEAVELYLDRVTADGVVALHISNKYVKLDLVAGKIAQDLGLTALVFNDSWADDDDRQDSQHAPVGKTQSSWVVLARDAKVVEPYRRPEFSTSYEYRKSAYKELHTPPVHVWHDLPTDPAVRAWTDDYADVLSVMMIPQIQRARRALGLPVAKELSDE